MINLIIGKPSNINVWLDENSIILNNSLDSLHYSEISFDNIDGYIVTQSLDVIKEFSKIDGEHKLLRIGRSAKTSNYGQLMVTEYDLESVRMALVSNIELR